MVVMMAMSVGWVLATALVYWFVARGYWLAKAVMLGTSALAAVGGGFLADRLIGLQSMPCLAVVIGAIVFTATAEALLLVFGMQRFGKS